MMNCILAALLSAAAAAPSPAKKAGGRKLTKPERAGATPYVFKTLGERQLRLFVMTPEGHQSSDKRPAIVFYHGGGWVGGAPGQFTEHCKYLIGRGMVTVQAQYRLLDRKAADPPEVCIADAKSAMRWVHAHAAELGVDPERIAAGGGSAGGHLATAVALLEGADDPQGNLTSNPKVSALVLFNPVYNNAPKPEGWANHRVGHDYLKYSPAHHIRPGAPPSIVFLGTNDQLIPVSTARKFQQDMQEVGTRSELILFEGEGHGFFNYGKGGGKAYRRTVRAMDEFLISIGYLTGAPTMPEEP